MQHGTLNNRTKPSKLLKPTTKMEISCFKRRLWYRPTTPAIGKTSKKIEKTGSVKDILKLVQHQHFALYTSNIATVSEYVSEDPNLSITRCSQELGFFTVHYSHLHTSIGCLNNKQWTATCLTIN